MRIAYECSPPALIVHIRAAVVQQFAKYQRDYLRAVRIHNDAERTKAAEDMDERRAWLMAERDAVNRGIREAGMAPAIQPINDTLPSLE